MTGDRFTLRLRHGSKDCRHHLSRQFCGINVLLLKLDPDPQGFQLADGVQTLGGVPGEAGDGLAEDLVDQPPAAVRNKPLEVAALLGRCAGYPSIRIDVDHAPVFFAGDQCGVISVLSGERVELIGAVRTDTDVGRYAQLEVLRLFGCFDNDHTLWF